MPITITNVIYPANRAAWRKWLEQHFATEKDVWLALPRDGSAMDYNEITEEALCFNWIDSTKKQLNDDYTAQRFSPRRTKAGFSQLNVERIMLLLSQELVHPRFKEELEKVARTPFVFPKDILAALQQDEDAWKHFQAFPEPHKRLRVASIEVARGDDELFRKRLESFVEACRINKMIKGIPGMDKYY